MTASPIDLAWEIGCSELVAELDAARASTLVYRRDDPATGRSLSCYTSRGVYAQAWDKVTMLARGLILDLGAGHVLATPFSKFFNLGEGGRTMPNLPFETYDKLDGNLAIIHFAAGKWRAVTKGDLFSAQALWPEVRLDAQDTSAMVPGTTYLAECTGPHARIVVRYRDVSLFLLLGHMMDRAASQESSSRRRGPNTSPVPCCLIKDRQLGNRVTGRHYCVGFYLVASIDALIRWATLETSSSSTRTNLSLNDTFL